MRPFELAYAVYGDPRAASTQSGVASRLGSALERRDDLRVHGIDTSPSQTRLRIAAALNVRRGLHRWRWATHGGHQLRHARSAALARELATLGRIDAVLALRIAYEPMPLPYVPYIDNTVAVGHRHWPPSAPWRGRRLHAILDAERRYLSQAAHVCTTGRLVAESVVSDYGVAADRVRVVGAGSHFDPVEEPLLRRRREPWILFVGYDFDRKGGDVLVEAFRAVRERHPEARVKLVGPRVGVDIEGVDVTGPVTDRGQLADLYGRSSAFAMPVRYEPFGNVFLEAMAHGLPCVASAVGALPEIVDDGETGFLVPPEDPQTLASRLEWLLDHPDEAARMGDAGRRRVAENFTWDAVADRITDVLSGLAEAPTRTRT